MSRAGWYRIILSTVYTWRRSTSKSGKIIWKHMQYFLDCCCTKYYDREGVAAGTAAAAFLCGKLKNSICLGRYGTQIRRKSTWAKKRRTFPGAGLRETKASAMPASMTQKASGRRRLRYWDCSTCLPCSGQPYWCPCWQVWMYPPHCCLRGWAHCCFICWQRAKCPRFSVLPLRFWAAMRQSRLPWMQPEIRWIIRRFCHMPASA